MLIIGAKGFAREVLEILAQNQILGDVCFYDDINDDVPDLLFDEFKILKSIDQAQHLFQTKDNRFTLGIGNPVFRHSLYEKFFNIGGVFSSTISPFAHIGKYGNEIGDGVNIMTGTVITSNVIVSKGVLINLNCTVGHDTYIGEFTEISPGANISGNCYIGEFCSIGSSAVILPHIRLGRNVTVGAGAVVNRNVEDDAVVVGIPAKELIK